MFAIVRCIIVAVLLGIACLIIAKSRSLYKKKLFIGSAVMGLALGIALAFLPFENLFITFSSPEEAYDYADLGLSEVVLVVPGYNTDLVVAGEDGIYEYRILPKIPDGWKLGLKSDLNMIANYHSEKFSIYVYQYKDARDCYINIVDSTGRFKVTDCYQSEFYHLKEKERFLGSNYYAHLPEIDPLYWITVNGETVCPLESQYQQIPLA